jgi:hypothetical protein
MTKFEWLACFVLSDAFLIGFSLGLAVATFVFNRILKREIERCLTGSRR